MFKSKIAPVLSVALFAFVLGMGFNNFAFSDVPNPSGLKIAVVDVNKVVTNSAQVKALKSQQDAKKAELKKWLETVKADINKQSTQENKAKLAKKYDADFVKKQEANRKDYQAKLETIDKNISSVIASAAQAKGYDIILSKSAVLYGGNDITNEIIKVVK